MKKPAIDIKYYVNIVLLCLLAFAAGYVTSPHMGKYSSFMLLIPITAAGGSPNLSQSSRNSGLLG